MPPCARPEPDLDPGRHAAARAAREALFHAIGGLRRPEASALLLPLDSYVCAGALPPPFLVAVLSNDLAAAVEQASGAEFALLPRLVPALRAALPEAALGSRSAVRAWMMLGGLNGAAGQDALQSITSCTDYRAAGAATL